MNDLLKSDNILAEPRVMAAWYGLTGKGPDHQWDRILNINASYGSYRVCTSCGEKDRDCDIVCNRIPQIYEAAFRMRDAAIGADLWDEFVDYLHDWFNSGKMIDPSTIVSGIAAPAPIHWIVAATLAWENAHNDNNRTKDR